MLVAVHAVGRMKAGAEQELAARYLDRFAKSGPAIGLEFSGILEIAEGRAQSADERRRDEADRLRAQIAKGAALIAARRARQEPRLGRPRKKDRRHARRRPRAILPS